MINLFERIVRGINTKVVLLFILVALIPISVLQTVRYLEAQKRAVENAKMSALNRALDDSLVKVKDWGVVDVAKKGVSDFHLITKYENGFIKYKVTATASKSLMNDFYSSEDVLFTIKFLDKDGFEICEIDLHAREYVSNYQANRVYAGFSFEGTYRISKQAYINMVDWNVLSSN